MYSDDGSSEAPYEGWLFVCVLNVFLENMWVGSLKNWRPPCARDAFVAAGSQETIRTKQQINNEHKNRAIKKFNVQSLSHKSDAATCDGLGSLP